MTTTESFTLDPTKSSLRSKRPWCLFQSGPSAYAVTLETVAEVVEMERLVRVPHSPPRIVGLCTLRREVIPVVELGEPADERSKTDFSAKLILLLLRTSRGTWAVRVNAEGTLVSEESMDEFVTQSNAGTRLAGTGLGTLRRGNIAYDVIDPEAAWHAIRRSVESWYQDNQAIERAGGNEMTSRAF